MPVLPEPSPWVFTRDPPVDDQGLVCVGADLQPGTLLTAYQTGLFPMPLPPSLLRRHQIAWFSPDPRGVIPLDGLKVTKSLRRSLRRYEVVMDQDFDGVVAACADPQRPGAWINEPMRTAYVRLHEMGWAHSVEAYLDGRLVGGLYGVRINGFFAGEAMFHHATDASKVALWHLVSWLNSTGGQLLDVQWTTPHLISLGAIDLPRVEYLSRLAVAIGEDPSAGGISVKTPIPSGETTL
jgi:leucyl/phenylalanyl-tRNA---protein transferase